MSNLSYTFKALFGLCALLSMLISGYREFISEKAYRDLFGKKSIGSFGMTLLHGFQGGVRGGSDFFWACVFLYVLKFVAQTSVVWLAGGTHETFEHSPLNHLIVFAFYYAGPFVALIYSLGIGEKRRSSDKAS